MFCDTGVPSEVLSDKGSQFTSDIMKEVQRLLQIQSITTSPYHAQCNGLCEKFNGTLKQMIKKMIGEKPKEWDRFLEPVLFAYREVPLVSLGGFSPFEMIYAWPVRGPMSILRELWTNEQVEDEVKETYQYVLDLRARLEETCKWAEEALLKAQETQKKYFDVKAVPRSLKAGDEVLLLLPTDNNKLLMRWKGPFTVKDKVGMNNYKVEINGKIKVFHINMLKQYFRREPITVSVAAITLDSDDEEEENNPMVLGLEKTQKVQTFRDVNINPNLSEDQKSQVLNLLEEYEEIFSSMPGTTNLIEHDIKLSSDEPIQSKPYPVPYAMLDDMKKEIDEMLRLKVIEVSDSPYSSPIVIIKKKDGTMRYCQDMRKVNRITRFDCEAMPDIDAIFSKVSKDKYFTKLDFCKGYWQIPMSEDAKQLTAFSTPFGHYQYIKMPFGLVNAGATYAKMMRKLLKDLTNVDNFVDDVLEHTENWDIHMMIMRELFQRIKDARLTVKPSKCFIGYEDTEFVGHKLKSGMLLTQEEKIEKIQNAPIPVTKKQVKSLLGLCGYYRRFVPHFAEKAEPLTDLTKSRQPDKVKWEEKHDKALKRLKDDLCSNPILKLPDVEKTFVLRSDASDVGLGAVLLQRHEDMLFPVAYISKKLLPRERNYSVIERECLAIIWAIKKFTVYLYGKEFLLQTDHQSLTYLDKAKFTNQRVMRWALSLQPYRFRVEYIKGEDNVGADFLSRHVCSD